MLAAAPAAQGVEYREAFAHDTGLEDNCADAVTCSQSLHWMEPEPALTEVARILSPGRIFAAYEYRWSVTTSSAVNAAFEAAYGEFGLKGDSSVK